MKKIIIIPIIIFLVNCGIYAQQISGYVMEKSNNIDVPLVGATIVQLGTTNGTITSDDGSFELQLINSKPSSIVVSFVSYANDTVTIKNNTPVTIILKETKSLNEVEVTARKKGSAISRTQTRSVININENELQKAACCNLSESFENSATVDVSYSDAVTGAKQIQMLGLAGIYTQLLTENIPNMRGLATPWGLGYIPGSWMSSIQVSKGTSSVINGYESMAGQINVELKKPDAGEKFFVNIYGNHLGKIEGNINARFNVSKRWTTAILAHAENMSFKHDMNGDSFLDQPMMSQINLFNRWKYVNNSFRMQFGIKYLSEKRQGGQLSYDPEYQSNPENGYGISVNTNRVEGFLKAAYIFKHRVQTSFGLQNQITVHEQKSFFGLNDYDANQFSYYGNLMFQSWFANSQNQFTTGISLNYDKYDEDLNDSIFNRTEIIPGGFIQYSYLNYKNLNIIIGLRLDSHNNYGLLFTPRVHAKYDINEHNIIRASAGRGFRSPNLIAENTSLLATSKKLVFDNNLNIESSWNYGISYTTYIDIGARELSITTDFFRTQFENQIIIDRENNPSTVYFYNLVGKSYSNSFQIETSYELMRNFEVTLAFRYNDVKTTISNNLVQKPLVNKFKGLLAVSYLTPYKKWQIDFNIQAIGNQRLPYTGFNPEEYQLEDYSPNYFIINTQITRYLNKFELYLGGENLGNYRQSDPIISSDDPFGKYFDSSIIWGPITGIRIFAGVRFKIETKK